MFRKKKPGLIKRPAQKRLGKGIKPREIDLNSLPYHPLPPAPSQWDSSTFVYAPSTPAEDFFEVARGTEITIGSISKIEMENRPDPAYRISKLQSSGVLFIDKNGRSKAFVEDSRASLLRRGFQGNITAAAGLDHDIYRIGTNPFGDHTAFLSTEAYLHTYNENFEPVLIHNLAKDRRISMVRNSERFIDDPPRRQIRRVSFTSTDELIAISKP